MLRDGKRKLLHQKPARIWLNKKNYLMVEGVKVCRYLPESNTFQFMAKRKTANPQERFIEVSPEELAGRLLEVVGD